MFDVVTFGSNAIDIFIYTNPKTVIKDHKQLIAFPVGSKILIDNAHFSTGGGGTNSAVAFSRLGLKTGYLGMVGPSHFGKEILSMLRDEKISFLGSKGRSHNGFSVILDSKRRNRTILAFKGDNNNISFKNINLKKLSTKWFYFTSLLDTSFKTQVQLANFAKKKGIKIAFNPSSYLCKNGKNFLVPILKNTDILILNKEEASMLVKGDLLKNLYSLGPKVVVITNGEKGAQAFDGKNKYSIAAHRFIPKECTGAGDSFAATFVASIIKGKNIPIALKYARKNAESVIRYFGAKNKLLKWSQLK